MTDELRVRQLLEELLDSGLTPEEACRDSPELLPAVRERLLRVRALEAEVEDLFPTPGPFTARRAPALPVEPPQIEGYAVEAEIGRGGVGVVYKARHLRLGRSVALKMLLAGEYAMPEQLARFAREAEVVAGLRHPNIVQVFDVGDHERRPYFTMEYLEGGSLAQKLAATPQPARAAAALIATLAEAMDVAHNGGIVHRDLKPANILLDRHGTAKISDFGLARRLEGGADLTLTGAALGTPSYMAPEQAMGKERLIGPAADIYSLGAMLYETLTGRPPFRAESSAETERQVIHEDPVRPSRLNAKVPRDLETICLKCLQKDPARRYASAIALADDLRRFLRGEPIAARPTGAFERLAKWIRRRPALAAAIAGATLLAFTIFGAVLWLGLQRASTARAVNDDLRAAALAEQAFDWVDARTAIERAKARMGDEGPRDLRERVVLIGHDLDLVARLDAIRLQRAAVVEGRFDMRANAARADRDYETAFGDAAICKVGEDAAQVAARVVDSNIRPVLVAAFDDWAICSRQRDDDRRLAWVLDVARRSDADRSAWREEMRDIATWNDRDALTELARAALSQTKPDSSLPCLMALAQRLTDAGGDAIPLLEYLQSEHPGDFWVNLIMGDALQEARPAEAVRSYQAALALRPDAAVVRNNLGHALALEGRIDEALDQLHRALASDPRFAHALFNLGNTLALAKRYKEAVDAFFKALELDPPEAVSIRANLVRVLAVDGRMDEALVQAQQAVALDPDYSIPRIHLGFVFRQLGRVDEAIEQYRRGIELDASQAEAHLDLGYALVAKGLQSEALEEFGVAIKLDPHLAMAHCGMSLALRNLGRPDEAIAQGEEAVRIDPKDASSHNDLAIALAASGREAEAIEHVREAVKLDPTNVDAHNNLGNLLGSSGQLDEAIEQFRESLRLAPDSAQANGSLGQALLSEGRVTEAIEWLRRGRDLFAEDSPGHVECAKQVRMCERLIELDARLPAVLAGREAPSGGAERIQFAQLCRLQRRFALAARFCEEAFTLEPALAENIETAARYNAACYAALAGSSRDAGAAEVDDDARAHWRDQARRWLRADLSQCSEIVSGEDQERAWVERFLTRWQRDPDLAGLRDEHELVNLPADEQQACRALWNDVDALLVRARESR